MRRWFKFAIIAALVGVPSIAAASELLESDCSCGAECHCAKCDCSGCKH